MFSVLAEKWWETKRIGRLVEDCSKPVGRRQEVIGRPRLIIWRAGRLEMSWLTNVGGVATRQMLSARQDGAVPFRQRYVRTQRRGHNVAVSSRVVGSEIPGNFLKNCFTYVNQLFPSPALKSDAVKRHVLDKLKQLSRSLCFNFACCSVKNNLFLARLSWISANSNENYGRYDFSGFW